MQAICYLRKYSANNIMRAGSAQPAQPDGVHHICSSKINEIVKPKHEHAHNAELRCVVLVQIKSRCIVVITTVLMYYNILHATNILISFLFLGAQVAVGGAAVATAGATKLDVQHSKAG